MFSLVSLCVTLSPVPSHRTEHSLRFRTAQGTMEEKPTALPPSNGDIEMEKHDAEKASSSEVEHRDLANVPGTKAAYVTGSDFVYPTPKEEAAVIRKLDWHIMPIVFTLYMLAVLDRSNLGNAKLAGLEDGRSSPSPQAPLERYTFLS